MAVRNFTSTLFERSGPFGGTWTSGGGFEPFASGRDALNEGIGFVNRHDSWGSTGYGSEEATNAIYGFISQFTSYSKRRNLGYFDYQNRFGNRGHYFEYDRLTGEFFVPGTNSAVNPFDHIQGNNHAPNRSNPDIWDPILAGVSLEFAIPAFGRFPGWGVGYDVGLIADKSLTGIGLYQTYKTPRPDEGGFSLSIAPEISYTIRRRLDRQFFIEDLDGVGTSFSLGVLVGVEIDSPFYGYNIETDYNIFGLSLPTKWSMDIGYTNWDTRTYITPFFRK
ncbi:hypothetical protein GF312_11860 [Candidatus Poribacteria bacterium]|nr:hypothetical protein [Candidatus Poribacteria bacterium]